jgi:hypothetical protein
MAEPVVNQALTALVAGAVGGVLGIGGRLIEQRLERRRRRRAIATALLHDLRGVELDSRALALADEAAQLPHVPASRSGQQFRRLIASDDLFLFGAETVSRLLYLVALLTSIDDLWATFPTVTVATRPLLHAGVRSRAWFLATHVRAVKRVLAEEGGTRPPTEPLDMLIGFELPEFGPPEFPEWTVPPDSPRERVWVNEAGRPRRGDPPPASG